MSQPAKKEHKSIYDAKRYLDNKIKKSVSFFYHPSSNLRNCELSKQKQSIKLKVLFLSHHLNSTDASCFLLKRCGVIQHAEYLPKCAVCLKKMCHENTQIDMKSTRCSYCEFPLTGN